MNNIRNMKFISEVHHALMKLFIRAADEFDHYLSS